MIEKTCILKQRLYHTVEGSQFDKDGKAFWGLQLKITKLLKLSYTVFESSVGLRLEIKETMIFVCYCIILHRQSKQFYFLELRSSCSTAENNWPTVNYHQYLAFDCPYLLCNDHCDWWLFQEILLLLLFCRNSFEQFWTCFLEIIKHLKQLSILCSRVDF